MLKTLNRHRRLLPPAYVLVLAMLTGAAGVALVQVWAAGRARLVSTPGLIPDSDVVDFAFGDDWFRMSKNRPWCEVHSIELGRRGAVVHYPPGASPPPLYPAHLASACTEQTRAFRAGKGQLIVRASGWPLRTWVVTQARDGADRPWSTTHRVRWFAALTLVACAAAIGALVATVLWATVRLGLIWSRRGTLRCVSCGYDLRGLPGGSLCPECGTARA